MAYFVRDDFGDLLLYPNAAILVYKEHDLPKRDGSPVLHRVIGLGALFSYVAGLKPEASPLGITIAIGAVIVMPYLYIQKKKNRQRDPVASTLYRRHRVRNMSLHGPSSSRRPTRRIFPRTLVG